MPRERRCALCKAERLVEFHCCWRWWSHPFLPLPTSKIQKIQAVLCFSLPSAAKVGACPEQILKYVKDSDSGRFFWGQPAKQPRSAFSADWPPGPQGLFVAGDSKCGVPWGFLGKKFLCSVSSSVSLMGWDLFCISYLPFQPSRFLPSRIFWEKNFGMLMELVFFSSLFYNFSGMRCPWWLSQSFKPPWCLVQPFLFLAQRFGNSFWVHLAFLHLCCNLKVFFFFF